MFSPFIRFLRLTRAVAIGGLIAYPFDIVEAGTATWNQGTGNWSDATQWTSSPAGNSPNNGNAGQNWNATVGGGTDTLDINIAIQSFTFSGGTVAGSSNLTVNQFFGWTGGTLINSGTTFANGGMTLDASTSGSIELSEGTLVNGAGKTASFVGTGNLEMATGATFINSGTFLAQNNQSILYLSGGGPVFDNTGVFTRKTATGTFTICSGISFENTGSVTVQSGTLSFQGLADGTGSYAASSGGVLQIAGAIFGGVFTTSSGGIVQGDNGTLIGTANHGSVVVPAGDFLILSETINNTGTIQVMSGTSGSATLGIDAGLADGTVTLTGGGQVQLVNSDSYITAVGNAGGTLINANNTIHGAGAIINDISLVNNGTINADVNGQTLQIFANSNGTGTYEASGGGILQIEGTVTGGVFTTSSNGIVQGDNGTLIGSANHGTITLGANNYLVLSETINNTGTILVEGTSSESARLSLDKGQGDGTATLTGGGQVELLNGESYITAVGNAGGTLINANNTIHGAGTIISDISLVNNGTINADVNGQTLQIFANSNGTGTYEASGGGILQIEGTVTGGVFTTSSNGIVQGDNGTLIGSANHGAITLGANNYLVLSETINNTGTILVEGTSSESARLSLDKGQGDGTVTLTGGGQVQLVNSESYITAVGNAGGTLINANNTIHGAGTVISDISLVNNGTINADVNGQTLQIFANSNGTGTYEASGGGILQIEGTVTGGVFTTSSNGIVQGDNGTLIGSANHGTITLGANNYLVLSETINNTGTILVEGTSSESARLSLDKGQGDGTVTLTGGGQVELLNGESYITAVGNAGGTLINANNTIHGAGTIISDISLINNGTINADVNGQTLTDNAGIIGSGNYLASNGGILSLQGGGTASGSFVSGAGSVVQLTGGYTLLSPSSFTGTGKVDFNNGTLSGSSTFHSVLTLAGPGTWFGGTLDFSTGAVIMDASGGANGEFQLDEGTLTIAAGKTATFVGTGNFDLGNGATFLNNGTFLAQNDATLDVNLGGFAGVFNNKGVFTRNTSAGIFDIATGTIFYNTGTVNVQTGTLEIDGLIVQYSGSTLVGGKWVVSDGATLFFNNGGSDITTNDGDVTLGGPNATFAVIDAIAANAGAFRVLGNANFSAAGTFTNSGTLQLGGGTFTATNLINNSAGQITGFGAVAAPVQLNAPMQVLVTTGSAKLTISGPVSGGGGGLVTFGPGTLVLSHSNSYSGGTTVNSGTLQLGNTFALGAPAGSLAVRGGTVDMAGFSPKVGALSGSGGAVITSSAANAATLSISGTASTLYAGRLNGSHLTISKTGSGTLTLTGSSNLGTNLLIGALGAVQISGGGVVSDVTGAIGYGTGAATVSGAGSKWTSKNLFIGYSGTGTLTLTSGALVSVTGTTTIGNVSVLRFDGSSTLNTGSLVVGGGVLRTLGPLTFSHSATLGTGGMDVDSNGFNSTFSGVFSGAGGLAKLSAGKLTLTGASTYTGPTRVNAGTLALTTTASNTARLGSTAITVAAGATFAPTLGVSPFSHAIDVGTIGAGSKGATLTLNAGSALNMADGQIGTFNLQQNNSFAGTAFTIGGASGIAPTLTFDIGNANTGTDRIAVTKTVSVLATGGKIAIDALASDTSITAGSYYLISSAGGFSGTGGNGFALSGTTLTVSGTTYDLSLAHSSATAEVLTVSVDPPAAPAVLYATVREDTATTVGALPDVSSPSLFDYGTDRTGSDNAQSIDLSPVPEPATWVSGFVALGGLLLLGKARSSKWGSRAPRR